jgi:hypothetical protein
MDPLALAAVVGLVFAGKRLSDDTKTPATTVLMAPTPSRRFAMPQENQLDTNTLIGSDHRYQGFTIEHKHEVASFGDMNPNSNKRPFGQPVYDLYGRQNITNKMNNLAPVERMQVGPGIGIGADVPSAGGFQQFFRVLPNNINEERLTTLEGGTGPSNAVVKNGLTVMGDVTHQAKDSKAWFRAPSQNQGQGQGGALLGPQGRSDHIKTRRTTIRQETGMRDDELELGPAQYGVYQPYAVTDKSQTRCSDKRSNPDRAGNGNGQNVRADPTGAVGAMTNIRGESTAFPIQAGGAERSQQYVRNDHDRFNEFKGNENPHMKALDVAILQLEKNEIAMRPLSNA